MAAAPTYPSGVAAIAATFVDTDGTNWKTIYDNSSSAPVRVEALTLCSDNASAVNLQLGIEVSGSTYLLGTVRVAALAGTDGAAAAVFPLLTLGAVAPDAIRVLHIPPGAKLRARPLATVSATKTVTVTGAARLYA